MKTKFLSMRWSLLLLLLTSYLVAPAQTRIGEITNKSYYEDAEKYFNDNIMLLDPIEGIWSIESTQQFWDDYQTWPIRTTNFIWFVVKDGYRYRVVSGHPFEASYFEKIGETNFYTFAFSYRGEDGKYRGTFTKRVALVDGMVMSCTIDTPVLDSYGTRSRISFSWIKEFPTTSIYNEVVAQQAKPSEWSGTGFALMDGYVVTNHHVVKDAASISVIGVKGEDTKMSAKVVAVDSNNDLALLRINDSRFNGFGTIPYAVKDIVEDTGSDVFVLGYPLTQYMGDEIKLTNGIISSKSGYQGDITTYQISAPVQPGNSGGPMFDKNGNVIGIVNAGIPDAENVGYAIKTSYLYNLVSSEVSSTILPKNNTISGLSLSEKVKKLKNFIFMITCSNQASNSPSSSNNNTTSSPSTDNNTAISPTNNAASSSSSSNATLVSANTGTTSGTNVRVINNPSVAKNKDIKNIKINKVVLNNSYTAIQFTYINNHTNGWCSINSGTYISVNGQHYTMTFAEGINVSPTRTFFSQVGEELSFMLYFPAIPSNATTIDLIESKDSSWRFYGINIETDNNGSPQLTQVASEPTGYINGYGYVDMGLSVKWATCNVGALLHSDYGDYYAWGEISTKSSYTSDNSVTNGKNMSSIAGNSNYDAARANWGGTWRLPTKEEIEELINNCKREWTTQGGHEGYNFTGPNGNSIFLPAASRRGVTSLDHIEDYGDYWSATPLDDNTDCACYLYFSGGDFGIDWIDRDLGQSVRPVSE